MCCFSLRKKTHGFFFPGDFLIVPVVPRFPPVGPWFLKLIHGNVAKGQREGVAGEDPNTQGSLGFVCFSLPRH